MGVRIQTAMIIDDDDDFVELLSAILESRKVYVMAIDNLEEAEENLNYLKPTVIFLDNNFPTGLGINFIRRIKDFDEDIRIVMMTADSSPWIREKAIEEGIDYFLRKPFSKKAVDSVLDKFNFRKVSMQ
jgi:DNA-binding response OmpR family regulator